ncbi:uncharacterized protein KY384_000352 [Bacidia gigantensis]|uniref:uncharacterized protein n=1 Tax=Bacidia gigantensis TaxID=2732470 RepID=UPI001D046DB1|nr:uncharacterized protein KY384_000352 [Bacidia gigantensis]KAG8526359.1 hypothetical protein KY384_000352 [Bacidia gigantensis]
MANVSAARLPKDFSRMDIKDLLGSNADSHQAPERRDSTFDLTASSDPHHTLHPTPSFPLPSSNAGPPILPSPAPSISSAPDYYHRRQSTPFPIKSEHPPASHPAWTREALQAAQWRDYHGYEASAAYSVPPGSTYSPNKRASSLDEHSSKRPKKIKGANQKWDAEEDARIIQLRGEGKKWAEISKRLPGRTEIACRLHFQNYLEKRGQWDEEKKTRLARVYERMRLEMWQPLAKELGVPWRSAEAMHWLLGEREIARRANTVPFALISGANTAGPQGEGNGRIAQANRMHDATIHFDPSDLAALQTGQSANGPISAFPYQHDVTTNGDAGHHARREYEGGNVSPTESNSVQIRNLDPQQSAQRDFPPMRDYASPDWQISTTASQLTRVMEAARRRHLIFFLKNHSPPAAVRKVIAAATSAMQATPANDYTPSQTLA